MKRPKPKQPTQAQRSAPDWWARAIGALGVVVAVGGLLLQWHSGNAERARRLEVRLSFASPVAKGERFPTGLQFEAVNPGYQVVAVAAAGFLLPDGSRLWFGRGTGDWQFPKQIAPGENAGILWTGQDLVTLCGSLAARGFSGVVTLTAFCQDGVGKFHNSVPLQFNTQDALKLARAQIEGEASPGADRRRESQ